MSHKASQLTSSFRLSDGREIHYYTITNESGTKLEICDYGARITGIWMPDKTGRLDNCVQRFDNPDDLLGFGAYYGATIGRFANRLAGASFTLNGRHHTLTMNENSNILHGGDGFHNRIWDIQLMNDSIICTLVSSYGDQGFPGKLKVKVGFSLLDDNSVDINYWAQSTHDTVVNLTNHSYFSLSGSDNIDILNQELKINADFYTPTNQALLPTGEILSVHNTPFDFTQSKAISKHIYDKNPDLEIGQGYDHNFVLRKKERNQLSEAAEVFDPYSGRVLSCLTTEPGIQLYTSNSIIPDAVDWPYLRSKHSALCLETQCFPNSMEKTWFPSPILFAGDTYKSRTIYRFSVRS